MRLRFLLLIALSVSHVRAAKPNVVIFYPDDFGWGDLHCHNTNPEDFRYTPTLDRLFAEGIELTNYMTHCVCSPSRSGLLTGRHYANTGCGPLVNGTLPSALPNFAKDFKAAGYRTGIFGKWHNSEPNFPEDGNGRRGDIFKDATMNPLYKMPLFDLTDNQFFSHRNYKWGEGVNAYGFDRWVGYYGGGGDLFNRLAYFRREVDWWHDRRYMGNEKGYTTDLITRYAIEFIEQSKSGPFLCYIPHEAVHEPIELKRSDLKEFCGKLATELGINGKWDQIRKIRSPRTGRLLGDVAEIRCGSHNGEFDVRLFEKTAPEFSRLAYAAYIYTLDKSIGMVIDRLKRLGLLENTIIVFASDNGATHLGCNRPFQGGKHSLWDGGVHVPAAIWWPGKFDCKTSPYAPGKNRYSGFIGYTDIYPTLMALAGQPCRGTDLDGKNCLPALKANHECRPDMDDAMFWMWEHSGTVRTRRWKLVYSQSEMTRQLYDLSSDVGETADVADKHPEVCERLVGLYQNWMMNNNYAVSYLPIDKSHIAPRLPAPEGDVLEVKATQTRAIPNPFKDGVFMRFAKGNWGNGYQDNIQCGDRIDFDIFVCEDSEINQGCYYTPARRKTFAFHPRDGVNQDGQAVAKVRLPKGTWLRQVIGVGNFCPGQLLVNYLALTSAKAGRYHYYLDNIVVRRNDGSVRAVIWASANDLLPHITVLHNRKTYRTVDQAIKQASRFPFSKIQVKAIRLQQ